MRLLLKATIISLAVAAPLGLAIARDPIKTTVKGHPNMAAAQKLVKQAHAKLEAAQKANEYDLGGHAQKAKELLKQVDDEIQLAEAKANENKEKDKAK